MNYDEVVIRNWQKFYELKEEKFKALEVFKWADQIKWKEATPIDVPKYFFLRGELRSLRVSFFHLVNHYCYADAAEAIAKQCAGEGDKTGAMVWRFFISNYHFYNFPSGYKSFLDYAARFIAGLTLYKIYEGTGRDSEWRENWSKGKFNIYYLDFRELLLKSLESSNDLGEFRVSLDDRKSLFNFLTALDVSALGKETWDLLNDFRNKHIHEYAPGLGHFTKRIEPVYECDPNTKNSTFTVVGFKEKATPDYYYKANIPWR